MNHHNCRIHVGRFKIYFRVLKETDWSWFWSCGLLMLLSLGLCCWLLLWWLLLLLHGVFWSHLWLLFLRWAGKYWHWFFILSVAVVVTKHVVLGVGVAIGSLHLVIGDRLSGRHGVILLILLSILSVVVSLGGNIGLGVGGRVPGPLGLDVSGLADGVDQDVQILIRGACHCPALLVSQVDKMLRGLIYLLVEAPLLFHFSVRGHELGKLLELSQLIWSQLGSSIGTSLQVSQDSFLLQRGQNLLHSQNIGNLRQIFFGSLKLFFLGQLLLVPGLILGQLGKL